MVAPGIVPCAAGFGGAARKREALGSRWTHRAALGSTVSDGGPMVHHPQTHGMSEADIVVENDAGAIRRDFERKLFFELAKFPGVATLNDCYLALSYAIRDRMLHRWVRSARTYLEEKHRTVIYLSAEYLVGPQLAHNVQALGIEREVRQAMTSIGSTSTRSWSTRRSRASATAALAASPRASSIRWRRSSDRPSATGFATSSASSTRPSVTAGRWRRRTSGMRLGNPWEMRRWHEIEHPSSRFGGHTSSTAPTSRVAYRVALDTRSASIKGVPYDTIVLGPRHRTTPTSCGSGRRSPPRSSTSRLSRWVSTGAPSTRRCAARTSRRCSTRATRASRANSCGSSSNTSSSRAPCRTCIRLLLQKTTIEHFADKYAVQLNDTHPSLAVPELMRLLVDVYGLSLGSRRGRSRRGVLVHQPHAACPKRSRRWPLPLFSEPSCRDTSRSSSRSTSAFSTRCRRASPAMTARVRSMSLIDEREDKTVRMANLATVRQATRSTASPSCTPSCSRRPCSATSPSCGPSASPT
jgi:starch phosphorylase